MTPPDRTACERLDADGDGPAFDALRARFAPGAPGTLHFDANSIGPMPADVPERMRRILDEGWRVQRRRGWNESDWLERPRALGAAIAPVLGAEADDVLVADGTSVNQFKLLRHALASKAPRRVIVAERDVFPSNHYVAEGVAHAGHAELRLVDDATDPARLALALAPGDVAVLAISHVDYRSSTRLDLAAVTALAHAHGALVLWDLSHSAGAVAVGLRAADADLAVGCGYKYLCGGPGAPGFVYVHPRLRNDAWPALCGWMGHADTFAFEPAFRPAPGVERFQPATPAVLANAAFDAAADIWRDVDPAALDARHRSLTDTLIALLETRCAGFGLDLASPRTHARRGGHVALRFPGAGPLAQALVDAGVVVSARKPDALRFGVHPLTTTHAELWDAVERLRRILADGSWRDPRFAGPSR
ncbi:MAG: aminotransferase class V-fold PLP-dependent enzyme [Burkholderiales bacterium]